MMDLMITFGWIFVSLLLAVIVIYALLMVEINIFTLVGINFVHQGSQYVIERLGKYHRTLDPGYNWIIPIIDRVGNIVDMREKVLDVHKQYVITKDNARVEVDGVVFHKVFNAKKATYEIVNLDVAIEQLMLTNIRSMVGSMDLDAILAKRDEINKSLLSTIDEATDPWGIKVTRIEIKDITPPEDLVDSMAKQMKAEREKRASLLDAEAHKEAAILHAQGVGQAQIEEAEAEKIAAAYQAEARRILADAETYSLESLGKILPQGQQEGQVINYFIAKEYVKALQTIGSAENQKLILMPYEATNLIGSLGGVSEIVKQIWHSKDKDTDIDKNT